MIIFHQLSHFFFVSLRVSRFQEVLNYFTDIIMGVEFLHMKGVIHKDLKTENILICENNRLKIADFGVSTIATK